MFFVLRCELWCFVGGLALLVGYRLLTGSINIDCLLHTKDAESGYSPARLQLLLLTLGCAIYYAGKCYVAKQFVPVPSQFDVLLGGSNGLYVVRKIFEGPATKA